MKLVYRIFKILAVVVIVSAVGLFSASLLLQDKVAGIIINSFNEKISTKYRIGSVRLSFLRRFPNAYLDLKNVMVHSSPGFDASCFAGIDTDTLLSAESVSVEFRITDIIKEIYNIERISIKQGCLNLFSDTAGKINYAITVETDEESDKDFILNLNRINLQDLKVSYNNLSTELYIKGFVETGIIKSRITGEEIDFQSDGDLRIDFFRLYNFTMAKSISTGVDVTLNSSGKGVSFENSTISFDGYIFGLSGTVSADNILDLSLYGDNVDISGITNYLPEDYKLRMAEYNPAGTMKIISKITGPVSSTVNPGIVILGSLSGGTVSYLNSALTIKDLSLDCMFNNGPEHNPATSALTLTNFNGSLGSSKYAGSLSLWNFDTLQAEITLRGKVIPSELKEFFDLKEVVWSEGNIDLDLRMQGTVPKKKKYTLRDVLNLDPVADLRFNSFGIGLKKNNLAVRKVNGGLFFTDTIDAKELKFNFRDHSMVINGSFINLPGWLLGDPAVLTGSATASCNKLIPELLFPASFSADIVSENKTGFRFPGDLVLDLKFRIDTFLYKDFNARNVIGTVSYKPGVLNFKSLIFNSSDGHISGNGFVVQNTDKSFIGKGTFILEGININKTFIAFHNFGQDFIKAENLNGSLSGTLSLLMPMDSMLKPVIKSLSAEGKYLLSNGSLLNFEPVKSLSSFIEVSELENIRFDKLENDFFIKNNFLYIPQMDINSSAADLSVNGQHSFDNNYEYHIKILLSELLSKKRKKPKPNTTEFGAIKDDGLGRTSMLLKLENRGDDVKVGYDVQAAGSAIRSNIKAERQTLRTILNQEYGWFKNDSTTKQTKSAGTPRFKITWEETADTVAEKTEQPQTKKQSVLKNVFKRK